MHKIIYKQVQLVQAQHHCDGRSA